MKRFREEPSLETKLALATGPINRDIALELLKKAEVQDALNFAIASTKDPRFIKIREVMNEEDIWEYWFKRDLEIVPLRKLYPSDWITHPLEWKTYYLWYRLAISCLQYDVLQKSSIMRTYPVETTFKFVRLNVIETNDKKLLDFRTEYLKFGGRSWEIEEEYNYENLFQRAQGIGKNTNITLLKDRYKVENKAILNTYLSGLNILHNLSQNGLHFGQYPTDEIKQLLSSPPRLFEETQLLVTSCLTCGMRGEDLQREETDSSRIFCNEICQLSFYQE